MTELDLLADLHIGGNRQGPGGDDETRRAIELSGLDRHNQLKIADIGCGTGASTLVLAKELKAEITAVDFLPQFLEQLELRATEEDAGERITTAAADMGELPFEEQSLDAIWSEGAIYNIGFEEGIRMWRNFLKPGGVLAVSELTWLTEERPAELEEFWVHAYPGVAKPSQKIRLLEANGYTLLGYFPLGKHCWLDNYYGPMQERFESFLSRHDGSDAASAIVEADRQEIALYERFSEFFSYGYFIAKRTENPIDGA